MRFINVSFMLVFIFILSMISLEVFAQEEPYMYYKEAKEGEESQGIQTGIVIAYGEKIAPPYFVTVSRDTIKINGILLRPPLKDPKEPKVISPMEKLSPEQRELVSRIRSIYKGYLGELEEKQAQERLISEYQNNPLISKL